MTGITKRIRAALSEGPSTVAELAAEFRMSHRSVQIGMWVLTHTKRAAPAGKIQSTEPRGCKRVNIYQLTDRGQQLLERNKS